MIEDIVTWFLDHSGAALRRDGENWIIERGEQVTVHPGSAEDAIIFYLQCALSTAEELARAAREKVNLVDSVG